MSLLSKSLSGTAVNNIKKIGGWKTKQVAWNYCILGRLLYILPPRGPLRKRATVSLKWKSESDSAADHDLPFSPAFQEDFAACTITGDDSKQDQISSVKIGKYIGFCVYRRSYLLWCPVMFIIDRRYAYGTVSLGEATDASSEVNG